MYWTKIIAWTEISFVDWGQRHDLKKLEETTSRDRKATFFRTAETTEGVTLSFSLLPTEIHVLISVFCRLSSRVPER